MKSSEDMCKSEEGGRGGSQRLQSSGPKTKETDQGIKGSDFYSIEEKWEAKPRRRELTSCQWAHGYDFSGLSPDLLQLYLFLFPRHLHLVLISTHSTVFDTGDYIRSLPFFQLLDAKAVS